MDIITKIMNRTKIVSDRVFNKAKEVEESYYDYDSIFLEGMERSLQLDGYSCGVQAAFSILKYYGKARSPKKIDKLLKAYNRGYASEKAIYALFRERGLKISLRKKATLSTIKESILDYEAPMLTTIDDFDHWVVVYGYSKDRIYVLDSVGIRFFVRRNRKKFLSRWDHWGAIVY
jgi:ABC-type bacteriocin/lantibiotic exporter with double-glycine peptidase domain